MADVGQEEVRATSQHLSPSRRSSVLQDYEAARKKALAVGAKKFFLEVRVPFFLRIPLS
jgi:hypothetical protein